LIVADTNRNTNKLTHGGCDTGPAATTARTAASTLPNEEGAFDGNIVEAHSSQETEKKAPAARRWASNLTKMAAITAISTRMEGLANLACRLTSDIGAR
jgi:hypothetical protein